MILNKKAQTNTINIIIAIILGIILIIFLIWGFSTDWRTFRGTTNPYTGESNIDSVLNACKNNCQMNMKETYCNDKKEIIKQDQQKTCYELEQERNDLSCPNINCE